ncbi:MAG: hypothetical protein AB7Q17_11480 [Phycisphaerae bacterium]
MNIAIGSRVKIELKTRPSNQAAAKTLMRLFRKDADLAKAHRIQKEKRPSWQWKRRGGTYWHHQMKTEPSFELTPGLIGTVRATLDIVRDLASVERFVSVTPAK